MSTPDIPSVFGTADYYDQPLYQDLREGTRLVSDLIGVEPGDVHVGLPVEVEFVAVDNELTLPMFRPRP